MVGKDVGAHVAVPKDHQIITWRQAGCSLPLGAREQHECKKDRNRARTYAALNLHVT